LEVICLVTIEEITDFILQNPARILAFEKEVDDTWSGSIQRLKEIKAGAFMSPSEVQFYLGAGYQLMDELRVNEMYESMENEELNREAHDHAQGFGL
jgi:hypothetical protein